MAMHFAHKSAPSLWRLSGRKTPSPSDRDRRTQSARGAARWRRAPPAGQAGGTERQVLIAARLGFGASDTKRLGNAIGAAGRLRQ